MRFLTGAALLAAGLFGAATAHNIQLPAHGRECFHESLHKDDRMTVTFQVGDREFGNAGNIEIDFWVRQQPARGTPVDAMRSAWG
jgi:p24 family protein beta-1